jgi:hypothetical protein
MMRIFGWESPQQLKLQQAAKGLLHLQGRMLLGNVLHVADLDKDSAVKLPASAAYLSPSRAGNCQKCQVPAGYKNSVTSF